MQQTGWTPPLQNFRAKFNLWAILIFDSTTNACSVCTLVLIQYSLNISTSIPLKKAVWLLKNCFWETQDTKSALELQITAVLNDFPNKLMN